MAQHDVIVAAQEAQTQSLIDVLSNGPWLVAGAILLSAALATIVALISISAQRIMAKKRAAYDFISRIRQDQQYISHEQTFLELQEKGMLLSILDAKTSRANQERLVIKNYLNEWELLCTAMHFHVVDEDFCKAYLGPDILPKRWGDCEALVAQIRIKAKDEAIYKYFQEYARKWLDDPAIPESTFRRNAVMIFHEMFRT